MSKNYRDILDKESLKAEEVDYSDNATADDWLCNLNVIKDILDEIEGAVNDIIHKLSGVEGLDLIEEVKDDLEELGDKLY